MSAFPPMQVGLNTILHARLESLRVRLTLEPLWFSVPSAMFGLASVPHFANRLTLHAYKNMAALTLDSPEPGDVQYIKQLGLQPFLNHHANYFPNFPDGDIRRALTTAGVRCFTAQDRDRNAVKIDHLSFLFSAQERLARYPADNVPQLRALGIVRNRVHALFVLDLIQDIEILTPLIRRAAASDSPFRLDVAVSTRIIKSHAWGALLAFLSVCEISWFNPHTSLELVSRIGSQRTVLVTAAESSAPGHAFCHQACKIAPSNTIRVTMQHGFECIGLRHHKAHDLQFPSGVRFASDVIFTWEHPDDLPNLHAAERDKCIATGVIKEYAESAVSIREMNWQTTDSAADEKAGGLQSLLIAENLHSVRFVAPARYQAFLTFIRAANNARSIDLTIRSHPGKKTLENEKDQNGLKFMQGRLTPTRVSAFDAFISPPSTILLDAAMIGVPAAVWSDSVSLGDASNYPELPSITDFSEWSHIDGLLAWERGLGWAVRNTAALNGVDAAWSSLLALVG